MTQQCGTQDEEKWGWEGIEKTCGDGTKHAGWSRDGKTYLLQGGDGDECLSASVSTLQAMGEVRQQTIRLWGWTVSKAKGNGNTLIYTQISYNTLQNEVKKFWISSSYNALKIM